MKKYTVKVPPTMEQGSYQTTVSGSGNQTYRQEALQDYNYAAHLMGLNRSNACQRAPHTHQHANTMTTKIYPPKKHYPKARETDRRHLWELRLAASRKNRSTNMTEPLTDAVITWKQE